MCALNETDEFAFQCTSERSKQKPNFGEHSKILLFLLETLPSPPTETENMLRWTGCFDCGDFGSRRAAFQASGSYWRLKSLKRFRDCSKTVQAILIGAILIGVLLNCTKNRLCRLDIVESLEILAIRIDFAECTKWSLNGGASSTGVSTGIQRTITLHASCQSRLSLSWTLRHL